MEYIFIESNSTGNGKNKIEISELIFFLLLLLLLLTEECLHFSMQINSKFSIQIEIISPYGFSANQTEINQLQIAQKQAVRSIFSYDYWHLNMSTIEIYKE